jgi:hypothetical protein
MIPPSFPAIRAAERGLDAERELYDALAEQLDDRFVVIYSAKFLAPAGRARVCEAEADFVVLHPEVGIVVIEAKGGVLSVEQGVWRQQPRTGGRRRRLKVSPFEQADRTRHQLIDLLRERGLPWEAWCIAHAIALPHCAVPAYRWGPDRPRELTIDLGDMGALEPALRRAAAFFGPNRAPGLSGVDVEAVADALGCNRLLRPPLSVQIRRDTARLLRLSFHQAFVLDQLESLPRVLVEGCAGSGKTVLALAEAERRARLGQRVALVCYNRLLGEHLRAAMKPHGPLVVAGPFLDLCMQAAFEAKVAERSLTSREWDELPVLHRDRIVGVLGGLDAVIVDEGQDFLDGWWGTIDALLRPDGPRSLLVFHDADQAIQRQAPLPDALGLVRLVLRDNHRTPFAVAEALQGLTEARIRFHAATFGRVAEEDTPPERLGERLAQLLATLHHQEGVDGRDIVVLTPLSGRRSWLHESVRVGPLLVARDREPGPGEVRATSIHKFKGVESPVVVVCEIPRPHPDDVLTTRLCYTAFSRATTALHVLYGP